MTSVNLSLTDNPPGIFRRVFLGSSLLNFMGQYNTVSYSVKSHCRLLLGKNKVTGAT
jgi:hypothetical protein